MPNSVSTAIKSLRTGIQSAILAERMDKSIGSVIPVQINSLTVILQITSLKLSSILMPLRTTGSKLFLRNLKKMLKGLSLSPKKPKKKRHLQANSKDKTLPLLNFWIVEMILLSYRCLRRIRIKQIVSKLCHE